jgi:outer membrane protein TolC
VQVQADRQTAAVALIQALGGGWVDGGGAGVPAAFN